MKIPALFNGSMCTILVLAGMGSAQTKPTITTTSLARGTVGAAYTQTLTGSGGITPYSWSATGLPTGLSLASTTGNMSGTPTIAGTFSVSVTLTDNSSPKQTATASLALTINPKLTITTTSLPGGAVGTAYNQTLAGSGGTTPYSWTATGLPSTMSLNATTGAITGTPSVAGSYSVSVTLSDSSNPRQTATQTLTLTINPSKPTVTTTSLPAGTVGVVYNATLAATGGTTPYAWGASGLPSGLSLNATTGLISGTPTVSGTFSVSVTLTDNSNPRQTVTQGLALTINSSKPSITVTSLPGGVVGTAYGQTLTGTGGTLPYSWSATGVPSGLSVNTASGLISGTPAVAGNFSLLVTLTDASNPRQSVTQAVGLVISSARLTITTTSLPGGVVGTAYSASLAGSGGITPYTWSVTGLPTGLSLNTSSGLISGTPTIVSSTSLSVTLTDNSNPRQTVTATIPVTISSASVSGTITLTFVGLQDSEEVLNYYNGGRGGSGSGPGPNYGITFGSDAIAGINLADGGSANASGEPSGDTIVTFLTGSGVVMNVAAGFTTGFSFYYAAPVLPGTITVYSGADATGSVLATLALPLTQANCNGSSYTYSCWTPIGVSLSGVAKSVSFSGTENFIGFANITIGSQKPGGIVITTNSLPNGTQNSPYPSTPLVASGGTPPYSWTSTGLPTGISLNSSTGVLSGTPTVAGTFTVTVTATDSSNPKQTATHSPPFTLVIASSVPNAPVIQITPSSSTISSITSPAGLTLTLGSPASTNLTATVALSFVGNAAGLPSGNYLDPGLQFAQGGTTTTMTINQGSTTATLPATTGIQPGSVAGTITVRVTSLTETLNGQIVALTLPTPTPSTTIVVPRLAPTITSVKIINVTSVGFTVDIVGSSTPRDLSSASLTFNPAPGAQLNGTSFTGIALTSPANTWFSSGSGQTAGGLFDLQIPFTFSGDTSAIGSVSVTLTNSVSTSSSASGTM